MTPATQPPTAPIRAAPFEAVVTDMDGVLTRTATLHERAWQRVFDDYLRARGERPFSHADYRAHVDGKPRYAGVTDFLASRGITLPPGGPDDAPGADTVAGLGNRKNAVFRELLDHEGAEVFPDATAALARWRRDGLKLAIVSSSRNCRRVLDRADLLGRVDVVVDGQLAGELGLPGKREIMEEASRRLGVRPEDAVVFEDACAGVRAARRAGFGRVLGVARDDNDADLRDAGAHDVVRHLDRARFPRRIPRLLDRLDELARWLAGRPVIVFVDFDGALAPLVDDPRAAAMSADTRAALAAVAAATPVVIVSGRDHDDVQARLGVDGVVIVANHGFDVRGRGHARVVADAADADAELAGAERELRRHLGRLAGVTVERKRTSVAVHVRRVASATMVAQVARTVDEVRAATSLRARPGKQVLELEPAVDWGKGRAVAWVVDALRADAAGGVPIYVGDDELDEDAFAAVGPLGPGVRVGGPVSTSIADYRLADPDEVRALLRWLAARGAA